ncbi:MAG: hypothetical protein JWM11_4033 [Planctomycetaceae bacterium]|nr:hypothetical protein [Planctomycetaceae bacterium]
MPLLAAGLGGSSAKTRSKQHCLRIEYNPKAVAQADPGLNRASQEFVGGTHGSPPELVLVQAVVCRDNLHANKRRQLIQIYPFVRRSTNAWELLHSLQLTSLLPHFFESYRQSSEF